MTTGGRPKDSSLGILIGASDRGCMAVIQQSIVGLLIIIIIEICDNSRKTVTMTTIAATATTTVHTVSSLSNLDGPAKRTSQARETHVRQSSARFTV